PEAAELLRLAVRAQLVDVDGPGFRFHHALTRDAVLATATAGDPTAMATRLLAALESFDPALDGERCQLAAGLALAAGMQSRAGALLVTAARRALAEGSLASADALATRASALVQSDELDGLLLEVVALSGQTDRARALGA